MSFINTFPHYQKTEFVNGNNILKMCEQLENILLRKLLSEMNLKTFYITNKDHYSYDAVFTTQSGITGIIEAKVRGKKYDDIILEVEKMDRLFAVSKEKNCKILYVNFFKTNNEGIYDYIIFNMTARSRKWAEGGAPEIKAMICPDKTFLDNNNKREKWCLMLKFESEMDQRGTINLSKS